MINDQNKAGLSAFALKMIMAALMLVDHLGYFFPHIFPLWFRFVGRLVAPSFAFLMTVSLVHTRNRLGYILRLGGMGLVMLAGSTLITRSVDGWPITNTIFLSLAVSAAMIVMLEGIPADWQSGRIAHVFGRGVLLLALIVAALNVEGYYLLPFMALTFYFLRDNRIAMCLVYVLGGSAIVWLSGFQEYQHLQALALIPIFLYNGEKGGGGAFGKWFFYLFYPLHIWALYLLRHWLFFGW
ncbi:MAG: conjugal transfer protein TraX [Oscillospiraceae bacterium]|nr:conjugal transfer protein TraX [Oscillospiraceae bacterium]